MGFFETLLRPDREELETADRMIVVSASNILQVGEFQFLQLAYHEWYGKDMPPVMVDSLFRSYMMHNEVPHWARHFARLILMREARGVLNSGDLSYHRYDHDYRTQTPKGVQHFMVAVAALALCMIASILIADQSIQSPTSRLPPYFDREELRQPLKPETDFPGLAPQERR
jgi:hypothetical protein